MRCLGLLFFQMLFIFHVITSKCLLKHLLFLKKLIFALAVYYRTLHQQPVQKIHQTQVKMQLAEHVRISQ